MENEVIRKDTKIPERMLFHFLKERKSGLLNIKNNTVENIMKNSKFVEECLKKNSDICKTNCIGNAYQIRYTPENMYWRKQC